MIVGSLGTGAGAAGVVVSGLSSGGGGGAIGVAIDMMTYCGAGGVCSGAVNCGLGGLIIYYGVGLLCRYIGKFWQRFVELTFCGVGCGLSLKTG